MAADTTSRYAGAIRDLTRHFRSPARRGSSPVRLVGAAALGAGLGGAVVNVADRLRMPDGGTFWRRRRARRPRWLSAMLSMAFRTGLARPFLGRKREARSGVELPADDGQPQMAAGREAPRRRRGRVERIIIRV